MGITVLYSSGDNGVAGHGNLCLTSNGTQEVGAPIFNPKFPSRFSREVLCAVSYLSSGTCPFITSVGATQVNPGAKVRHLTCRDLWCSFRLRSQILKMRASKSSSQAAASATTSRYRTIRRLPWRASSKTIPRLTLPPFGTRRDHGHTLILPPTGPYTPATPDVARAHPWSAPSVRTTLWL